MARLAGKSHMPAQRQADGSWVFEGQDHADFDEDSEDEISADPQQRQTSRTVRSGASQTLPAYSSQAFTFTTPHIESPVFPSSLDARSTTSSRNTGAAQRRTLRSEQRTNHEQQFVMPSMDANGHSPSRRTTSSATFSPPEKRPMDHSPVRKPYASDSRATKRQKTFTSQATSALPYLGVIWTSIISPILGIVLSVFGIVFSIIKPLLAIGLALWLLVYLGQLMFTRAITSTIAPICAIPGVSLLNLPFCNYAGSAGPVEFNELMTVQSAFEDVLATSAGGATLPLDMKRSEASIRDLRQVVQYSALPSRQELVFEFTGFIDTARQAAADLTRFNSRIGRAVDHVLSTNKWTLQVIDGVAAREEAQGTVGRFLQSTGLTVFTTGKVTEELLLEQYLRHTRSIEEQISALILEGQTLLAILQNLDDRTDIIHSIVIRDGVSVQGNKEDTLAQLWTWLGGNRGEVKKHNEQLSLLMQLGHYRKNARDHIGGTMLKLQAIAAGLEDLRERVAAPEVVGIRGGGVPLSVHIERIQMGIDRLEEQRGESRRVEGMANRAILDRDGSDGRRYVEAS